MKNSMFTAGYYVTAELRITDETKIDETTRALNKLCATTRNEPGCRIFVLHQNSSDPRSLLLWECFDDEAAFKAHFEYAHTKDYFGLGLTEVLQIFKTTTVE